MVFLDIHPISRGHLLIVPKKHVHDIIDSDDDTLAHIMQLAPRMGVALMAALEADGFNIGINTGPAAGQIIMHAHVHVIPRWSGDGLVHWSSQTTTAEQLLETASLIKLAL